MRISGKTIAIVVVWAAIAIGAGAYFAVNTLVKQRLTGELAHFSTSMEALGLTFTHGEVESDPVDQRLSVANVSLKGTLETGQGIDISADVLELQGYQVDDERDIVAIKQLLLVGLTIREGLPGGHGLSFNRLAVEGLRPAGMARVWRSYQAGLSLAGALETNGFAPHDLVRSVAVEDAALTLPAAAPGTPQQISVGAFALGLTPEGADQSAGPVYFAEQEPTISRVDVVMADGGSLERITVLGIVLGPLRMRPQLARAEIETVRTGEIQLIAAESSGLEDAFWRTARAEGVFLSAGAGLDQPLLSAQSLVGEGLVTQLGDWEIGLRSLSRRRASPEREMWRLEGLTAERSYGDVLGAEADQLSATVRTLMADQRVKIEASGAALASLADGRLTIEQAQVESPSVGRLTLRADISGVSGLAALLPLASSLPVDAQLEAATLALDTQPLAAAMAQDLAPGSLARQVVRGYAQGAQTAAQRALFAGLDQWMQQPDRLVLRLKGAEGVGLKALLQAPLSALLTPATLDQLLTIEVSP